jgi:2,4-dienoyl-CoA reductase-like NADH-dependent reductase (Old Yellow Enzyme family)
LFEPITLRNVTSKNRILISPMCQYSAIDGIANDWHLVHLGKFAQGGAGMVMVEAAAVTPEGRITHGDVGLWRSVTSFLPQAVQLDRRTVGPKDIG